jgi:isocitrate/isopropylmalate dehydrogenase
VLVSGSKNNVDLLVVGEVSKSIVDRSIKEIENHLSREINYSVLSYNEFYYRLSVRDKFIMGILNDKHVVIVDKENILKSKKED